jgi:hypothetical protein
MSLSRLPTQSFSVSLSSCLPDVGVSVVAPNKYSRVLRALCTHARRHRSRTYIIGHSLLGATRSMVCQIGLLDRFIL